VLVRSKCIWFWLIFGSGLDTNRIRTRCHRSLAAP
jgi:hypothetical protein